jgi:hypothetical protein
MFDYLFSEDYGKTYRTVAVNLTREQSDRIAAAPRSRNVVRRFVPVRGWHVLPLDTV